MAATKHEYYNAGDNSNSTVIHGTREKAQTITVGEVGANENNTLTEIKLKLYRIGSPGTVTVELQGVSGTPSEPNRLDIKSTGTYNGNTITTSSSGEWITFTMDSSFVMQASTQYAIVCEASSGDLSNYIRWRRDTSSPTYNGIIDCYHYSTSGGAYWGQSTWADLMFEQWGEAIGDSGWTGDVCGVTNPAEVNGVAIFNIATINGI